MCSRVPERLLGIIVVFFMERMSESRKRDKRQPAVVIKCFEAKKEKDPDYASSPNCT